MTAAAEARADEALAKCAEISRVERDAADVFRREAMANAAQRDEALALLRECEWAGSTLNSYGEHEWHECPTCRGNPPEERAHTSVDSTEYREGHAADCRLAAALEGKK